MAGPKSILIELARRQIGTLRSWLDHHDSHQIANKDEIETACFSLNRVISNSRVSLLQLSTCLETIGDDLDECNEVVLLMNLLQRAAILKSKLEYSIFGKQRKDSLTAFAHSISPMIERGEAGKWISSVSREEIINHGGELNRLYQLFVEGKSSTSSFTIDSATLKMAAERTDLFSEQQCRNLRTRSIEVELLLLKETECLVLELQGQEKADKFRHDMELLTCDGFGDSNSFGPQSVSHEPPSSETEASSSQQDSSSLDTGWPCTKCTFLNTESLATEPRCGACGTPQTTPSFVEVAKRRKPSQSKAERPQVTKLLAGPKLDPMKKTIWIRNSDVPELIGPHGKNIQHMMQESGASNIYAYQQHVDQAGMCPVEICGNTEAIQQKAVAMIEKKFALFRQGSFSIPTQKAGDEKIVVKHELCEHTISIRNAFVPDLIGPGGKTVRLLIAQSGVKNIYAYQRRVGEDGMCPVQIYGRPEAVQKAAELIRMRFTSNKSPQQGASNVPHLPDGEIKTPNKEIVWIRNAEVPDFIGPGGKNVRWLKKETKASSITAYQELVNKDGMCPIYIRGSSDSVREAASIIKKWYGGVPHASESTTDTDAAPGVVPSPSASTASTNAAFLKKSTKLMVIPSSRTAVPSVSLSTAQRDAAVEAVAPPLGNQCPPPPGIVSTLTQPLEGPEPQVTAVAGSGTETVPLEDRAISRMTEADESLKQLVVQPPADCPQKIAKGASVTLTAALKTALKISGNDPLHCFLIEQETCLTCTPVEFYNWLVSVDISSLGDFSDALNDDEFVRMEMKGNGLKYFKRFALKNAIVARQNDVSNEASRPAQEEENGGNTSSVRRLSEVSEAPNELICPIRQVLMVIDPVLARDGYSYERDAIQSWFDRAQSKGTAVLSPITGEPLADLTLVPNAAIKTMARDFARAHPNIH